MICYPLGAPHADESAKINMIANHLLRIVDSRRVVTVAATL